MEYNPLNGDELKKFFIARVQAIVADKPAFTDQVAHFGASFTCQIKWLNDQADGAREVAFMRKLSDLPGMDVIDGSGLFTAIEYAARAELDNHPDLNVGICHLEPAYTIELEVTSKAARLKKGQSVSALEEPLVDSKGEKLDPHTAMYTDQGTITYPDKVRESIGIPVPGINYSAAEIGATNVR